MQLQSQTTKLAEVSYRAKILKQHLGKNTIFPNEPTSQEFKKILKERLKQSKETFKMLEKRSAALSPYLEVGAEYSLRSSLLENRFGAVGFSSDISLPSLMHSKEFAKLFNFKKVPKTICADAYNLPFKSGSFPFIFIYETLHHFPDPKPVLDEVKRVLAPGGTCLIGAEPIRQSLQIRLWRRPNKLRLWERILKATLVLPFISYIGKTEVDHGILEETFSLRTWQKALTIFDKVEAEIKVFPFGPSQKIEKKIAKNWLSPELITKILLAILGGSIQVICFKGQSNNQPQENDLNNLIICPSCIKENKIEIQLYKTRGGFQCPKCNIVYKKKGGVLLLLEKTLKNKIL